MSRIQQAAYRFDVENPEVWELFKKFALQAMKSGREHYGAASIFERIRWHVEIETRGGGFKLNNNFRAYYARKFNATFPHHVEFFRVRRGPETR